MATPPETGNKKTDDEKRWAPRAEVSLLIQYRFESFEAFLSEYATDISNKGMFIRSDEPREVGSLVYLQFTLKDGSKLIEGLGKVVRVIPPSGKGGEPAGMGIQFVNFDDESQKLVEQIVSQGLKRGT